MQKRILVLGGAGFIGSHLCERLLADGDEVLCVDNLLTGRRSNIIGLEGSRRFKFLRHDVTEPFDFEADQIYNLACPASPVHYQSDPIHTIKTSVLGAINVLELAKRIGAPVLQTSTSEVYGDPEVHPQPEGYWGHVNPVGPRSCYDEGKRCAETLFSDYRRIHDLDTKIVRIFNTYGPRMSPLDGRVVSNFIVQALRGDDITIHGNGDQTRSFCFVDDMIDALMAMMRTSRHISGPINIGNPVELTVRTLAELVLKETGSRSRITYVPLPTDDPRRRKPDISVARKELGWTPKVDAVEGVRRTIAYFDQLLAEEDTIVPRLTVAGE